MGLTITVFICIISITNILGENMGKIKNDIQAALERDPAAKSKLEVFFLYPGFKALYRHRRIHWLYMHGFKGLARFLAYRTRRITGVDIHPAAKIGSGVFIDHATGVVIGETAEIGNNVTIYQGVTIGGTGKEVGKRHPTIEDNVMIASGAKVLGPITIGKGSKIGAGSVVLKDVPPFSTVVGVPGRIVKTNGSKIDNLDQTKLPDPILDEFKKLNDKIEQLKKDLEDAKRNKTL